MKLKSHFLIFTILFIINIGFCWFIFENAKNSGSSRSYNYFSKRIVPDKVKFKSGEKEVLVIKTDKASGTTKLEINMPNLKGEMVSFELKAKQDPENLKKLKYKYKDEDDDKLTFVTIKYPEPSNDPNQVIDDSFKILYHEKSGVDAFLCKVKFGDGNLKIGSDEQLATPTYEIRTTIERKKKRMVEKLKVYYKGMIVASVSKSSDSNKYKGKKVNNGVEANEDLYSTKDLNYMSLAVGIMGVENMDPRLRAVVAAEILKKEK